MGKRIKKLNYIRKMVHLSSLINLCFVTPFETHHDVQKQFSCKIKKYLVYFGFLSTKLLGLSQQINILLPQHTSLCRFLLANLNLLGQVGDHYFLTLGVQNFFSQPIFFIQLWYFFTCCDAYFSQINIIGQNLQSSFKKQTQTSLNLNVVQLCLT